MIKLIGAKALLFGAALALSTAAAAQAASPSPAAGAPATRTADLEAHDFYVWYVHLMATDKEAWNETAPYNRYVSKALRAKIARDLKREGGMDADYFVKAQDYAQSWLKQVTVSHPVLRGPAASVRVQLGAGAEAHRLAVKLIQEDGRWKIASVAEG